MDTITTILIVLGYLADLYFISLEYAGKKPQATLWKGIASAFFVALGIYKYSQNATAFGILIVIGLALGLVGDVLMNLRNMYEGALSKKIFALGIAAFLAGHIFYIVALLRTGGSIPVALIATAVLAVIAIPPLMRAIDAPSKGLKIFGIVYLTVVIGMFVSAVVVGHAWREVVMATDYLYMTELIPASILFSVGALLFVVSDFVMIYNFFGRKKIACLRAINLLTYYTGQIMIALSIGLFVL